MMKRCNLLRVSALLTVICTILVSFCACSSKEMVKYYSQKDNYINLVGRVSNINYNMDCTALYIGFSETTPVLDDVCFKIVGDNLQIAQTNGIDSKLKVGDEINFITAPKYFGDGYVMPIVAISINGENLLDFEEGYENLLSWLSK